MKGRVQWSKHPPTKPPQSHQRTPPIGHVYVHFLPAASAPPSLFPGYSVTTLNDGRRQYFVAGAPRSNHTGQVIVYTLSSQKQTAVIDSERGKQVLAPEKAAPDCSCERLTGLVLLLDRVLLRQRPLLSGRGRRWSDRPPAGRGADVHERAEERGRQGLHLLCHQGNRTPVEQCWLAMLRRPSLQLCCAPACLLLPAGHPE